MGKELAPSLGWRQARGSGCGERPVWGRLLSLPHCMLERLAAQACVGTSDETSGLVADEHGDQV